MYNFPPHAAAVVYECYLLRRIARLKRRVGHRALPARWTVCGRGAAA